MVIYARTPAAATKLVVLLLTVSELSLAYMIPIYLAFMMKSFIIGTEDLDKQISYNAGIIEGLNRLMSLFGCIIWGHYSDRIGRQHCLILNLSGMAISSIGFGLSTSFEIAVFWRCLAGICSGTVPITKAILRDLSDDSNIAVLYSYFGSGTGVAAVIGPLLGGSLAHPYKTFPVIFDYEFFHTFPYFLPHLAHAMITIGALIMVIYNVPNKKPDSIKNSSIAKLFRNSNYVITITIFGFASLAQFSFRMILALWFRLNQNQDGLGWQDESRIGLVNGMAGIIIVFFPLFFTPYLKAKLGIKNACMLTLIGMIPIAVAIPTFTHLSGVFLWFSLSISIGIYISLNTVFTSLISIAVTNSVNDELVGRAMGLCQGYLALFKAVANSGSGLMFGAIVGWGLKYPFNVHFMFYVCIIFLTVALVMIKCFMSSSTDQIILQTSNYEELLGLESFSTIELEIKNLWVVEEITQALCTQREEINRLS